MLAVRLFAGGVLLIKNIFSANHLTTHLMRSDKFIHSLSGKMLACGRYRMSETYCSILHRLEMYCDYRLPALDGVFSPGFLHGFHSHLLLGGLSRNTVSFYITGLRSIYAFAVQEDRLSLDPDLFSSIACGSVPTEKRAVSAETIALLHAADLSDVPRLDRCRDLFMLSFHLQGMPFVDLAHLRKSDIQGNLIAYRRHKTGGTVCVSLIDPARDIFDKYAGEVLDSPYLLPLVTFSGVDGHRQYQSALRRHNRQLKDLGSYLGIKETLSSYVARHSWATLAYHNGVDVGVVSQAMGHHTEEVTRIYLSSFDQQRLAEANHIVLQAILRPILDGRIQRVREGVKEEVVREFGVADVVTSSATVAVVSASVAVKPVGECRQVTRGRKNRSKGTGTKYKKNVRLCSKDGQ